MANVHDDQAKQPTEAAPRKPMEFLPNPVFSISPEERKRRAGRARETVAFMESIHNGPDEDDAEFLRALDGPTGRFNLSKYYTNGSDPA